MKKILIFVMLLESLGSFAQCIPDVSSDLLGYWCFSGNADDCSGNGRHGVVTGTTPLTPDRCLNTDQAYSFGGSGQYITVANEPALNLIGSDFTIAAWTNLSAQYGSTSAIVAKRIGSTGSDGYMLHINNELHVTFSLGGDGSGSVDAASATIVNFNEWNHIVAAYDFETTTMRLYINGALDSETPTFPSPAATNTDFMIANDFGFQLNSQFTGMLDEIRLYNRELNACDIDSLFNSTCLTTGLKEEALFPDIQLFPNPGTGEFHILIPDADPQKYNLTIINLTGEQVISRSLTNGLNQLNFNTAPGIYYAMISSKTSIRALKLIVK